MRFSNPISGFRNPKNRRNHFAISEHTVFLADELLFQRMLSLERRRCERTGTRFALILVSFEQLNDTLSEKRAEEIARVIGASMRETDIAGWYRQSAAIGIVLTTLTDATRETLESVVVERIRKILELK